MAGPLTLDRERFDPLRLARLQDAAGWLTLALLLVLAPWARLWELVGLSQPSPAGVAVASGVALAAAAVVLLRAASARAVAVAAAVDAAGALAVAAWWLAATPADGIRGTLVLAVVVASLAVQASFDLLMLREGRDR